MNDAWGYNDDANNDLGNTNELDGPKALREAYKAQGEILKQIQQQLADEKAARTKEKLSSVFESLGVPGAAELYQGEPDPEKARAWAETMRATFGGGAAQGETPSVPATPPVSPEVQQQLERMTEAGQTGTPMGNFEAAEAAVGGANSINDLIAAFARANNMG